jgi:hypothetical protein
VSTGVATGAKTGATTAETVAFNRSRRSARHGARILGRIQTNGTADYDSVHRFDTYSGAVYQLNAEERASASSAIPGRSPC